MEIAGFIAAIAGAVFAGWQIYLNYRPPKRIINKTLNPALTNEEIESPNSDIAQVIEDKSQQTSTEIERTDQRFIGNGNWEVLLEKILLDEIPKQTRSLRFDSKQANSRALERLIRNPSFYERLSHDRNRFLNDIDVIEPFSTCISTRLGIANKEIHPDFLLYETPIRVSFAPTMLAVSAIIFYLKHLKGYNIEPIYGFTHTLEMVTQIKNHLLSPAPDLCIVADAPALSLINSNKPPFYHYLMMLPRSEQRIVAPRINNQEYGEEAFKEGIFNLIVTEQGVSSNEFMLEELERKGLIDKASIAIESLEPHQSLSILTCGDSEKRLILYSPYWRISEYFGLSSSLKVGYFYDTILFVKHSFLREKKKVAQAFMVAIYNAWLNLSDPSVLKKTIHSMISEKEYVELVYRYCGLYNLGQSDEHSNKGQDG
jgi:hypothetical protein